MLSFLKKIIGGGLNFDAIVAKISALEPETEKLSSEALKEKTLEFKERLKNGETLDDILPEAFALTRETAKRTLGQRHYDVQLIGGIVLHRGAIAEMMTGEGKTLASTAPVYLNALSGCGVHVVTVNEYLAKRDTVWMGQIYHALGLRVACLVHEGALLYDPDFVGSKSQIPNPKSQINLNTQNSNHEHEESLLLDKERDLTGSFIVQEEFLRPIKRREAYEVDITYGTNHEFGFDYLRDNLAYGLEGQVQTSPRGGSGELNFAIIDEIDSILIDEARTPLIISAPDTQSSEFYKVFARVADKLRVPEDYEMDEKMRTVSILDKGIDKVEKMLGLKDFYAPENIRLVHYLEESLKAAALFKKDKDYVVKNNEIIIVDQFTGRLMLGRRYSGGLHQAIEAKEGVLVKEESRTYAKISIQNYFRMYKKIAGMTGTASTSAEEFHKVYNLEVQNIPPNKPVKRNEHPDVIYKTKHGKYEAVTEEVKKRNALGQPILIGTSSIENNEVISSFLSRAGIGHEVLNAKNHEREGAIIAQAGKLKSVTVATNMAGRGVDIILGGNPPNSDEAEHVKKLGGLIVIGTERHDARRVDNQLRGRAARQGDPGESQFFLSMEDDLLRIFGGERIQNLMQTLNVPEDMPIESKFLSRAVSQAQAKVEGFNFDSRKHMLEYDDILNKQRTDFYLKRQKFLVGFEKEELKKYIESFVFNAADRIIDLSFLTSDVSETPEVPKLGHILLESGIIKDHVQYDAVISEAKNMGEEAEKEAIKNFAREAMETRLREIIANDPNITSRLISVLDMLWMTHLENMEALQESVRLRAYAQHDPLVEFRRESYNLYKDFFAQFGAWIFSNLFRVSFQGAMQNQNLVIKIPEKSKEFKNVGRNDPCPCGSGKKYKRCHG
ncbi:MAG: preprotein translocase subunit SecA [Candidatus Liptonbacteria bacterium]|nr:preprotein translocase subunit SecA [Candidatus Liptonbacteria bacterium]